MTDIIDILGSIIKLMGTNPQQAGGWFVALVVFIFMIWRLSIVDKKYDAYVTKLSEVIVTQEKEWRTLISKTEEMTFDMLKESTTSMSLLSEKINTLQLILLQYSKG